MQPQNAPTNELTVNLSKLLKEMPQNTPTHLRRNSADLDPLVVSKRIKEIRIANGYTLEEAAVITGISKGKLSKAENFKKYKQSYSGKFLQKYAFGMVCTVDYLLGIENNPDGNIMNSVVALSIRKADQILTKHSEKLVSLVSEHAIRESSTLPPYKKSHKDKTDLMLAVECFIESNSEGLKNMPNGTQLLTKFYEVKQRNKSIEAVIDRAKFSSNIEKNTNASMPDQLFLQLTEAVEEETTKDNYFE